MKAEELRSIRKTHYLTQRALAVLLGYTANYIARLERGEETITEHFAKHLRAVLGRGMKIL